MRYILENFGKTPIVKLQKILLKGFFN